MHTTTSLGTNKLLRCILLTNIAVRATGSLCWPILLATIIRMYISLFCCRVLLLNIHLVAAAPKEDASRDIPAATASKSPSTSAIGTITPSHSKAGTEGPILFDAQFEPAVSSTKLITSNADLPDTPALKICPSRSATQSRLNLDLHLYKDFFSIAYNKLRNLKTSTYHAYV